MKKFLSKCLLFVGIAILLFAALLLVKNKNEANTADYMGAMADKHRRLDSIKAPKIIFAGVPILPSALLLVNYNQSWISL